MKIEIETQPYSIHRRGRPYIAIVDFSSPEGVPKWGTWVGTPGDAGVLVVEAAPGNVVMTGQRGGGHRAPPRYGQVRSDGGIEWMSKAKAYRAWQEAQGAAGPSNPLEEFDTEFLLEEIRRRGVVSCPSCSQRGGPSPS